MSIRSHILLVEDDSLVLDFVQETLNAAGYRISTAGTVSDACVMLRTSHVDLALVDFMLPDGSGATVIGIATQLGVPAIEMSGYPQEVIALENCPRAHLTKPFRIDALLTLIEEQLGPRVIR